MLDMRAGARRGSTSLECERESTALWNDELCYSIEKKNISACPPGQLRQNGRWQMQAGVARARCTGRSRGHGRRWQKKQAKVAGKMQAGQAPWKWMQDRRGHNAGKGHG